MDTKRCCLSLFLIYSFLKSHPIPVNSTIINSPLNPFNIFMFYFIKSYGGKFYEIRLCYLFCLDNISITLGVLQVGWFERSSSRGQLTDEITEVLASVPVTF